MPKTKKDFSKDTSSRSWFAVLNNPQNTFGEHLTPEEMIQKAVDRWIEGHEEDRSCGVNYERSETGTEHMHLVLEGNSKIRFSAVKKIFEGAHLEETQGSKKDAEDYLYKRGKYKEKNHTLIAGPVIYGEIRAKPRGGAIKSSKAMKKAEIFEMAEIMIENGETPKQIFEKGLQFRQYDGLIRKAYFDHRFKETPIFRKVKVYYHFGTAGSGKTRTYSELCEKFGDDHVFFMNDYSNAQTSGGGFDSYGGEEVLFLDEFKGQFSYAQMLTILDGYRSQVHARYANVFALWTEVHITSIYPPETVYELMVPSSDRERDTKSQLFRRIDYIVYHYKDGDELKKYVVPADRYINEDTLLDELIEDISQEYEDLKETDNIKEKNGQLEQLQEKETIMEQMGFSEIKEDGKIS